MEQAGQHGFDQAFVPGRILDNVDQVFLEERPVGIAGPPAVPPPDTAPGTVPA